MKNPNYSFEQSQLVYIRRKPKVNNLLKEGEVEDPKHKIGSSYKQQAINRGLTFDEEKLYLPSIIGISSTSEKWETATKEYWANISAYVPSDPGLELETGFAFKTKEDMTKGINGIPINIPDYVLYRYCLGYSHVANTIDVIDDSPKIRFYIFDKEKEVQQNHDLFKQRKDAYKKFLEIIGDRNKVDEVLNVMGLVPENMDDRDKDLQLEAYAKDDPLTFITVVNDKNLGLKSFIESCLKSQKLTRIPNTETIQYGEEVIGYTMDETIAYLTNPRNSAKFTALKAQMQMMTGRSVPVVKEEETEEEEKVPAPVTANTPASTVRK